MACCVNKEVDCFIKGFSALFNGASILAYSDPIYEEILNFLNFFSRRCCLCSTNWRRRTATISRGLQRFLTIHLNLGGVRSCSIGALLQIRQGLMSHTDLLMDHLWVYQSDLQYGQRIVGNLRGISILIAISLRGFILWWNLVDNPGDSLLHNGNRCMSLNVMH